MQTFRDYMETALYDPRDGFYPRRTPREDFYTACELHPAFGSILARELVKRLSALKARGNRGPYFLVEMGSGEGRLAAQILKSFETSHPQWIKNIRYVLVERSSDLLLKSVTSLASGRIPILGYSSIEDLLPCSGVFFSNELVDAFPVHLLEKKEGRLSEVYVDEKGGVRFGPLSRPELAAHAKAAERGLRDGDRHAVNLEMLRWLKVVSSKLQEGFLITIDYGKRFHGQPNAPRAYRKHRLDDRLTEAPGSKDITASVDFEALIAQGKRHGFAQESYESFSSFLIKNGIGDFIPEGKDLASYRERVKIKTLIHPEGMGEAFKVLIQEKRVQSSVDRVQEQRLRMQKRQSPRLFERAVNLTLNSDD